MPPWQPDVPQQPSPGQFGGFDEPAQPGATPWQRGGREQSPGHPVQWPPNSREHAPTSPGQPGAAPADGPPHQWQPDPATQWQPNQEPAPTLQWQPAWQSDPALSWTPNAPTQDDPTLLAQSLGDRQPGPQDAGDPTILSRSPGPWPPPVDPDPVGHGRNDPTMLGQPLGALDQPGPSRNRRLSAVPDLADSAPTQLGYPADLFGRPAQVPQWQSAAAPGRYGPAPDGLHQPGYGRQSGFGGPPPNRPNSSGRGKLVLSIGLAVLLVGGLVAGVVALTRTKREDAAQGAAPSMVNAVTTTTATAPTRSTTATAPTTTARGSGDKAPVIPGFQVVRAPDSGAAYDVPADWTIAPQSTIGGFGEPPNAVAGKGLASEGKGYCPGSTRTVAFLTGSDTSDPGKAATELGTRTATLAYKGTPGGTPGLPMPLASLDGSQHGMFVETKGTVADAKPGCAKAYSVYTAAFPNDQGNFVMVIAADTGVPHALDAETAKRIFASIRPLAG
ncbi:hypothetical protein [Nocardia niwae]|uniref:hypothetical protein n=1 Tax=Nocardia niwae TaxID=626084 RepID=UPI0007A54976|nr:hypothetical protein [Nocardia niwae]